MSAHSSAGVYKKEDDQSIRAEEPNTSTGVIVGEFDEGPVNERTLVTSEAQLIAKFGRPNVKLGFACHSAIAFLQQANQLYITRVAPGAKFGGARVSWSGTYNSGAPWPAGTAEPLLMDFDASTLFDVYAIDPGDWNQNLFLRIYPDTKEVPYFYLEVYIKGKGSPIEKHRVCLPFLQDGFGTQRNVQEYVNRNSSYIRVSQNYEHAEYVKTPNKQFINTFDAGGSADVLGITLFGGTNGPRPTTSDLINALDLYRDPEVIDVSIFMSAGYTDPDYLNALANLCKERMDCVSILDTPSDKQEPADAIAWRRGELATDTNYAALYAPDVYVSDKYTNRRLHLPISGYVGAIYALTDRDYAYYFAPAGMTRGDLAVSGVRRVYEQGERDAMYESQINCVRVFDGSGIKVWGADTLQIVASALSNMPVRRLMIGIEKALSKVLLYSVFDPNSALLRSRLESRGNDFLKPLLDKEALYYFKVVCDDTNNTAEIIAAGDLNVDIYIDPTLPVKRIHLTAVVNKTGVRVTAGANS